jgi:arylsulfatase A-like enzyme
MDWWPTVAALAGAPVPANEWKSNSGKPIIFDGIDLSDSLLGKGPGKRDSMIYIAGQSFGAIRVKNFKIRFYSQGYLARPNQTAEGWRYL